MQMVASNLSAAFKHQATRELMQKYKTYTVKVTKTGIRKGTHASNSCPVARAINACGLKHVHVDSDFITIERGIDEPGDDIYVPTPKRAAEWIKRFDGFNDATGCGTPPKRSTLKPFAFRLRVPLPQPEESESDGYTVPCSVPQVVSVDADS